MEAGAGCDFMSTLARHPHVSVPPLVEAASGARVEAEARVEELLGIIRQEVLEERL